MTARAKIQSVIQSSVSLPVRPVKHFLQFVVYRRSASCEGVPRLFAFRQSTERQMRWKTEGMYRHFIIHRIISLRFYMRR